MVIKIIPKTSAWDHAVSLDKHIVKSVPIGPNAQGYMQFDTERTLIGEEVFRLKYRSDFTKVDSLAQAVIEALQDDMFPKIHVVVPMPASKKRAQQPVYEVAKKVAQILGVFYTEDVLVKIKSTGVMKDLESYGERVDALKGCFEARARLNAGPWNILVIDDLYDTGASLEAACTELRKYTNIKSISIVALTRRH